jgi:rhamnosyltransferase
MNPEVLVSIVIPVKNGDAWLKETIPAMLDQDIPGNIEIIAIDSGSTDNTLSILAEYPVKVIQIKPEEFNHGETRNLGVSYANGKYVVLTVQDAKPANRNWLKHLMDGFLDDKIAGVCGQQIVPHHHDKNPMEWYRPISKPEIRRYFFEDTNAFKRLSPEKQLSICRWDDVNAMYRRDLLLGLPFRKTDFAEDVLWAKDALLAGYGIVYNPLAQVEHYHLEDYQYALKRNFIVLFHFFKYFGIIPQKQQLTVLHWLRVGKLLMKEKGLSWNEKWKWFQYNVQNHQAANEARSVFLESYQSGGENMLYYKYGQICHTIPQAPKKLKDGIK